MGAGGGPTYCPINPTASQAMSPTDLPQCRQLPGGTEKPLDHQESTLWEGLACLPQGLGLKHQLLF